MCSCLSDTSAKVDSLLLSSAVEDECQPSMAFAAVASLTARLRNLILRLWQVKQPDVNLGPPALLLYFSASSHLQPCMLHRYMIKKSLRDFR